MQTELLEKSKEAGPNLVSKMFLLVLCTHGRSLEFSFGSITGKNYFLSLGHCMWILPYLTVLGNQIKHKKIMGLVISCLN